MGLFTKGTALSPANLKREKFALPECGKDTFVWLRALSAKEVTAMLAGDGGEREASDNDILALCVVDDEGKPIFTDGDDVRANLDVAADSLVRMVEKVVAMSGLNKDRSKN